MNIRDLRESAGLTQGGLAMELGVGQSTVAMWENGTNVPRASLLPKLAEVLHCSIDDLYAASTDVQEGV
ncbi:MAG: helix-turn-helix transcriptional regulator [Clostridia bacterium]|nr:helix-turn-helix transcriptional regulator [Clostridia bacterium]